LKGDAQRAGDVNSPFEGGCPKGGGCKKQKLARNKLRLKDSPFEGGLRGM